MPAHQQYAAAGNAAADALADQRRADYPPTDEPAACGGCGGPTTADDFWVARWAYYFSKLPLASALSVAAGKPFVSTVAVPHATYHWLCGSCAGRARAQRAKGGVAQFVGLFLAIVGLIGVMVVLAALFAVSLPASDRATVSAWSWVPPVALVLGVALTFAARSFRLPGALGRLAVKPFHLESLFGSDPAKLEALQREYPDLYGLGTTPGASGRSRTFDGDPPSTVRGKA